MSAIQKGKEIRFKLWNRKTCYICMCTNMHTFPPRAAVECKRGSVQIIFLISYRTVQKEWSLLSTLHRYSRHLIFLVLINSQLFILLWKTFTSDCHLIHWQHRKLSQANGGEIFTRHHRYISCLRYIRLVTFLHWSFLSFYI